MRILTILVLIFLSVGILQSGWIPLLFLTGGGIWWLIKTDKHGASIDSFFALIIPVGVVVGVIVLFKEML